MLARNLSSLLLPAFLNGPVEAYQSETTGDVPLVSKVGFIVLLWPHSLGNCSLSTWAGTEEFGGD